MAHTVEGFLVALLGLCWHFYTARIDEELVDASYPHMVLAEYFSQIDALGTNPSTEKIVGIVAELQRADTHGAFFGFGRDVDNRDRAWTIGGGAGGAGAAQPGLLLRRR